MVAAGAKIDADFKADKIEADWKQKTIRQSHRRYDMFITSLSLENDIASMLSVLYNKFPQIELDGKIFADPTDPGSPIIMLHDKGNGILMISVMVRKYG